MCRGWTDPVDSPEDRFVPPSPRSSSQRGTRQTASENLGAARHAVLPAADVLYFLFDCAERRRSGYRRLVPHSTIGLSRSPPVAASRERSMRVRHRLPCSRVEGSLLGAPGSRLTRVVAATRGPGWWRRLEGPGGGGDSMTRPGSASRSTSARWDRPRLLMVHNGTGRRHRRLGFRADGSRDSLEPPPGSSGGRIPRNRKHQP